MITDAPVQSATPFESIQQKLAAFLATAQVAAVGGITWAEFGQLMLALVRLAVETLEQTSTLSGTQKKALVLEAVAALFDNVADRAVPTVAWPVWILVRPAVRSLVVALADGAVEQVLQLVRS